MERAEGEVVLVTGASGFLGQHLLKHLENDDSVSEIRALDKIPLKNAIGYSEKKRICFFKQDLLDVETCRDVVAGVDVVFHCAALVSFEYPPDKTELHKNNVIATENLLRLCIEENVPRFVHCSTTEVTLQSYFKGGIVALIIYGRESKSLPPENQNRLIFGEYAASKLAAEKLVLQANGTLLGNGQGVLYTVSLRPPFLYGEGDKIFISKILEIAKGRSDCLIKPAGAGGKHQLMYVGNAAWAFICAKNTLKEKPEAIAGLPVVVTDDTLVEDALRFCERVTRNSKRHVNLTRSIPMPISYTIAYFIEFAANYLGLFQKIPFPPRSIIAYLGSVVLYSRARASIHMNYEPIHSAEKAFEAASKYYCDLIADRD